MVHLWLSRTSNNVCFGGRRPDVYRSIGKIRPCNVQVIFADTTRVILAAAECSFIRWFLPVSDVAGVSGYVGTPPRARAPFSSFAGSHAVRMYVLLNPNSLPQPSIVPPQLGQSLSHNKIGAQNHHAKRQRLQMSKMMKKSTQNP